MKIAIIGFGKMGKMLKEVALARKHDVVTVDPVVEDADFKEIDSGSLEGVDVCIEFTVPSVAIDNIKKVTALKKSIVVGTTAWYDHLEEAKKATLDNDVGLIYSPNFSIGVNVFFKIIKNAANMIGKIDEYNLSMKEIHHIHKKDAPSGTGKMIKDIIVEEAERFKDVPIESVREGEVPGTHIANFDSSVDTIKLEHEAKSREGFALGAVMAAEWLKGKKGFFDIDDLMKDVIGG